MAPENSLANSTMARKPFPIWTIVGAVIFGVVSFGLIVAVLSAIEPGEPSGRSEAAVVTIIPAPSETPIGITETPIAPPTPTSAPAPGGGSILTGSLVQIGGTGGDGLRLRAGPSLEDEVRFLGIEAEVFEVIDGPIDADGYTWFLLLTPRDEERQGWAVSTFLVTVQNP